ncbi:MAG: hypothetical protein VX254_05485 [Planctomycetota bacterium]|nr:hypothetical protein [Planctomycetota bacterium]
MTRRITSCLLLTIAGISFSPVLTAHVPRHLAGTQCQVFFFEDRVEISIDLGFRGSWAQAEMLAADTDRNSRVEKSEAEAYLLKSWQRNILRQGSEKKGPAITCSIDGVGLELELVKSLHEGLVGQVAPTPFSLYYTVIARARGAPLESGSTRRVEILNRILEGEVPGLPLFLVPFSGHGQDPSRASLRHQLTVPGPEEQIIDAQGQRILIENRKLAAELSLAAPAAVSKTAPPAVDAKARGTGAETAAPEPRTSEDIETWLLSDLLNKDGRAIETRWLAVAFLLTFLLGASHCLGPGHGKSVIAAYLAGSSERYRDALILGMVTTVTHTLAVITVGSILLMISSHLTTGAVQERLVTTGMLLSGILLTAIGLVLFTRRAAQQTGEAHEHGPEPGGQKSCTRELLCLGISSGLLPCTPGILLIFSGLHQPGKLFLSLLLLLSFSLGLGFVLLLTGLLTVSGKKLLSSHRVFAPLRRKLPGFSQTASLASALLILALGAFLLSRTIFSRPVEIAEIFAWMRF